LRRIKRRGKENNGGMNSIEIHCVYAYEDAIGKPTVTDENRGKEHREMECG
jgi:hypothetical protein